MMQEDRELLLKDLCARLPYGVECLAGDVIVGRLAGIVPYAGEVYLYLRGVLTPYRLDEIKLYLRSMSSMTEEERNEHFGRTMTIDIVQTSKEVIDWLNAHHFDYRGLIPMGLAIAVTEENNPYET